MESTIFCPQRNRLMKITEEILGRKVRCKECKTIFIAGAGGPLHLRLVRRGAQLTGWHSADGVNWNTAANVLRGGSHQGRRRGGEYGFGPVPRSV